MPSNSAEWDDKQMEISSANRVQNIPFREETERKQCTHGEKHEHLEIEMKAG